VAQPFVDIDGSFGEGGGQILRTSASLAAALGRDLRMTRIRANRPKPGLGRQHLTALKAVAAITGGDLLGGTLGSERIELNAGSPEPGGYEFDIGTAGSTSLVIQTVLPVLLVAPGDSTVAIAGGTHNPMAPCYEYLARVFLPLVSAVGVDAMLTMDRAGFYPAGGGHVMLQIRGLGGREPLIGLNLTQRGDLRHIDGLSAVSESLPEHIGERQATQVIGRLRRIGLAGSIEQARWVTRSPGTVVFVRAVFSRCVAGFFALGERGKPAEAVADEAMDALEEYLNADGAADPHAADQLPSILTVSMEASRYTTTRITDHLLTNAEVVRRLTGREITIEGAPGETGQVTIAAV